MRIRDKLAELLSVPLRNVKSRHDAALVAVQAGEVAVADLPRDLTARRLDLDDLGAEVGQHHRRVRAGQHDPDLENADARQRARRGHRTCAASSAITSRVRYFEAISSSRLSPIGSRRTDRSVTPASANGAESGQDRLLVACRADVADVLRVAALEQPLVVGRRTPPRRGSGWPAPWRRRSSALAHRAHRDTRDDARCWAAGVVGGLGDPRCDVVGDRASRRPSTARCRRRARRRSGASPDRAPRPAPASA